jgi:uncharacterized protein (DUF433 family)
MTTEAASWPDHIFDLTEASALTGMWRSWLARCAAILPPKPTPGTGTKVFSYREMFAFSVGRLMDERGSVPADGVAAMVRTMTALSIGEVRGLAIRFAGGARLAPKDATVDTDAIVLSDVLDDLARRVASARARCRADIGRIDSAKSILGGTPVLAGTRVPVRAMEAFIADGFSINDILREYPSLTPAEIEAVARRYLAPEAA